MMKTPSLRSLKPLAPFALLAVVTACGGTVIRGGGSGGNGAGIPCDDCEPLPVPKLNAIAITMPEIGWGCGTGAGAGGSGVGGSGGAGGYGGYGSNGPYPGCGSPPNVVYLDLGNPAPTCSVPMPSTGCGASYNVSIGVPESMLVPGMISLSDLSLTSTFSETGASNGPDPSVCPGGGGGFTAGSLTIQSVDAARVIFTLSGTLPFQFSAGNADGTYSALRCP
jgi:hypothetical protein